MLRNLEKNVIFRAIITKKSKKKKKKRFRVSMSAQAIVQIFGRFKMVPFPFTSQRYYQFSRFILQFCYSNNNVYFFVISLIDIQPKMGQINIRKKMIFLRNLEDFLRNLD